MKLSGKTTRNAFALIGIATYVTLAPVLTGCSQQAPVAQEPPPAVTDVASAAAEFESRKASPITAQVVDEIEFARILATKKGSVVLVDYWATWCPSCLQLLPHTLELAEKWRDRGLTVLTLSFDDPDEIGSVVKTLEKFGARTENFVAKYGASEESVTRFAVTNGALPHYKIYDREGNLRKELLSGGTAITPESIETAVEELLTE